MTELTIGARPVDADVPCAACDYNLRGLPENGRCPECATPIARSLVLAKAGLTRPERSWLWGQVTACWILLAAAAWELSWGAGLVPLHGSRVWRVSTVVGMVIVSFGAWLLGQAEPDEADRQRSRWRRLSIRAGVVAWASILPLAALLRDQPDAIRIATALIGIVGGAILTVVGMAQLSRLASRFGLSLTAVQFAVLGVLSTLVFLVMRLMPSSGLWGPGSNVQPLLLDMRTVPHAVAALARRSPSSPPEFAEALVLFILGTGCSLWFVGLLAWTCWRLTTALRAIGRRTEPSSPP